MGIGWEVVQKLHASINIRVFRVSMQTSSIVRTIQFHLLSLRFSLKSQL